MKSGISYNDIVNETTDFFTHVVHEVIDRVECEHVAQLENDPASNRRVMSLKNVGKAINEFSISMDNVIDRCKMSIPAGENTELYKSLCTLKVDLMDEMRKAFKNIGIFLTVNPYGTTLTKMDYSDEHIYVDPF